jgi:hypothetical protein
MSANIKATNTEAIIGVNGGNQLTVSDAGVVTANSFVGLNGSSVTATGSTTARTLENRFADVVNVKDFGALGNWNGTIGQDDTTFIQNAVTFCNTNNTTLYWPSGTYRTTASITDFHNIHHSGDGIVERGGNSWYITPKGTQENVIYCSSSGNSTNDGLSLTQSSTFRDSFKKLNKIADRSQDGIWRIQISGSVQEDGVSRGQLYLPSFKNKLRVWGDNVANTVIPTTVITPIASRTVDYCFWFDNTLGRSENLRIHLKNIKFANWTGSGGAIVIWGGEDILVENCDADNCLIPFWFRSCKYLKQIYGRISNNSGDFIVQYHTTANIGDLTGGGVSFTSTGSINVGRQANVYIQGCTFTTMTNYCIEASRCSRIRTQSNNFVSWGEGYSAVWINTNAVWTPDNYTGSSDTYPSLSITKPAYRSTCGGTHLNIDTGTQKSLHASSQNVISLTGTTSQTLLNNLSLAPYSGQWVPFRLPEYFCYGPDYKLEVEIFFTFNSGWGGEIALHAGSSLTTARMAYMNFAPFSGNGGGTLKLTVCNSVASTARYSAEYQGNVDGPLYIQQSSPSQNISAIRSNSENLLLWRLYCTPTDATKQVNFQTMKTYVEA